MTTQLPLSETTPFLPAQPSFSKGSSLAGCVFNFTNSIVGAGCMGLGGVMAASGGLVSIVAILWFAMLSKFSFDLLIDLSEGGSYEQLAFQTYGKAGSTMVSVSRFLYAYGCLVAYIKIVDDNLASGIEGMTGRRFGGAVVTFVVSATVMLPLSLLRDMTPLQRVSLVKILVVLCIIGTVTSLYPANHRGDEAAFQQHWLDVRPSLVKSLGTIVFTFVSQHVVHLTYDSLKPEIRTISNWKIVSTLSVILSTLLSLAIAVSIYVTFWDQASSNIFELYPPSTPLDVAKLLLSFMMMCTYPSPFFACRELIILSLVTISVEEENNQWWLLEPKQLILPLHVFVTLVIWSTSTVLALLAPSLGDVLNLVGCASGTMIAFILPAMFSFRLKGYTHLAGLIFVVGGAVGIVGTFLSLQTLLVDAYS